MAAAPASYSFKTVWNIPAPVHEVWDVISHPLQWPSWWKGVEEVTELRPGDAESIGSISSYTWKSFLPYRLTFNIELVAQEKYRYLKGTASGELQGSGEWYFASSEHGTVLTCIWNVSTRKPWMNRLSFLLRPIFAYNHSIVMNWGEKCLKKKLGVY